MTAARQNRFIALGLFFYGLVLFTCGLDHREIIGFESRFYLFALEMWRHGPTWFATTYHQPYPDYPATGVYFIYLFSKMLGELDKFTAIFPSAVAAALTLSVTYLIGALYDKRWGIAAVCVLLFTNAFVAEARTVSLDQYTTLVTAACFYLAYSAKLLHQTRRLIWIFPLLIFGFAMRGPIGLVIPTGVLCIFYMLEKDVKRFLITGILAILLLVICGAILLGIAYQVGGEQFVKDVLQLQAFGRMNDGKALPWSFYWLESFGAYAIAYPLAILVLLGVKNAEPQDKKLLQNLLGWALIIVLGLSIPSDKKIRYILPFAPALALICGYLVTVTREKKYLHHLWNAFNYFCMIFPFLCVVALIVVRKKHPELNLDHTSLVSFFILMEIVLCVLHWQVKHKELVALFIASFTFVMGYIFIAEPINLQLNKTRDFVLGVEALRLQQHAQLVFYHEGTDGLVIKYLVNTPTDVQPVFVNDVDALSKLNEPVFVVSTEENFQQMPKEMINTAHVVTRGRLGREIFVVFVPVHH